MTLPLCFTLYPVEFSSVFHLNLYDCDGDLLQSVNLTVLYFKGNIQKCQTMVQHS